MKQIKVNIILKTINISFNSPTKKTYAASQTNHLNLKEGFGWEVL